jgi:hypothetical protein
MAARRSSRQHGVSGELVTESLQYDGGRQVTVYVPPDPPEAIVFAGDGQALSSWGADLENADLPSTMVVGVHRATDETRRLHEYSPGFDPGRFGRTRPSSSTSFDLGRRHGSGWHCPPSAQQRWVSRRVESWRSPWASVIPRRSVSSSVPRRGRVTARLTTYRCRFPVPTWSPERRSRSSSRTRPGGRRPCAREARTSSWRSASELTETRSGDRSFR